jgi:hypothetical protein
MAAGCVLAGVSAFAQDKAKIEDVYKQALGAAGANQVNVRSYDVSAGMGNCQAPPLGPHVPLHYRRVGGHGYRSEIRTAGPGQVISQLPGKSMIMRNASQTERLKFVLFQVGTTSIP